VTLEVIREYFVFLRETVERQYKIKESHHILLVLDVYASHREGLIKDIAAAQHIDLLFIPPGMRAELQPLDAEIFGQLKSAGSKF
jgi:hypothetical protein